MKLMLYLCCTQDVLLDGLLCNLLSNQTWRNFDSFFTQFLMSLLSSWVCIKCIHSKKEANQLVRYKQNINFLLLQGDVQEIGGLRDT